MSGLLAPLDAQEAGSPEGSRPLVAL
jgi:hypothetical protein